MIPRLLVATELSEFETVIQKYLDEHNNMHNSVFKIFPEEGKRITIEQIRQLKKELLISSTKRLIIIYDFQTAKTEAQNALLKTLEDQTDNNQFILCTNHLGGVLPTIVSRCHVEILSPTASEEIDIRLQGAIDILLQKKSYSFLNDEVFQVSTIEEATQLFSQIIHVLHQKIHAGDAHAAWLAGQALEIASLLKTNNINPQLAVDSWCLLAKRKQP